MSLAAEDVEAAVTAISDVVDQRPSRSKILEEHGVLVLHLGELIHLIFKLVRHLVELVCLVVTVPIDIFNLLPQIINFLVEVFVILGVIYGLS